MIEDTNTDMTNPEESDELSLLKTRADIMGIKYHPSIGVDKLREKVNEELVGNKQVPGKTAAQLKQQSINEAKRLKRIRVTCMDPNRVGWKGDYFTLMNSTFGSIKKYIPFSTVWHVENALIKMIKRKTRQEFYETPGKFGLKIKRSRRVPMYAVEELPDLTKDQLEELARQQIKNNSIDDTI